jgi:glycosyltransferase involved in cell wall biosynthesis
MFLVGNGTVGGAEESVLSMVRHLRAVGRRVLVGAPYYGEFTGALLEYGLPPENLHVLEMGDHLSIAALAELVTLIRVRGVNLLHSHLLPAANLAAAAGHLVGMPALSTLHGSKVPAQDLFLHQLYGLQYIAVSQAGRDAALARGIMPDAVSVIPNGVDLDRFDPAKTDRDQMRRELGVNSGQILVTSVARLSWEKYPEDVVDVADRVLEENGRLVFAFAGTGPLEYRIRDRARRSTRPAQVRVLGLRRDIPEILSATDIVVLSSLSEGLPFALLEAMAMERPVVAYDVLGVNEAVTDGSEGYLATPGDRMELANCILRLACCEQRRREFGLKGRRKVVRQFRADETNAALLSVYDRMLNARVCTRSTT